jgi:nucleoside-diphosphate-sugar epimerase
MTTLITGYPGFEARALVHELLNFEPDEVLHLVVLPRFIDAARKRFAQNDRVRLHRGDVVADDLGLCGDTLVALLGETRRVFHFAAIRHPSAGRGQARTVNVRGTQQVLRFVTEAGRVQDTPPRLVHLSTLFVLGGGSGRKNAEARAQRTKHRNWLEAVAHQAEELVLDAHLPWTVLRPGLVLGDSQTGRVDKLGGLYRLGILAGHVPKNIPLPTPAKDARLHAVAVDTLACAARRVSSSTAAVGRIIVIDHPEPLPAAEVLEAVAEASGHGTARWPVNLSLISKVAPMVMRNDALARDLTYLNDRATYDAPDSVALLAGLKVPMPPPRQLMKKAFEFTLKTLREERARRAD